MSNLTGLPIQTRTRWNTWKWQLWQSHMITPRHSQKFWEFFIPIRRTYHETWWVNFWFAAKVLQVILGSTSDKFSGRFIHDSFIPVQIGYLPHWHRQPSPAWQKSPTNTHRTCWTGDKGQGLCLWKQFATCTNHLSATTANTTKSSWMPITTARKDGTSSIWSLRDSITRQWTAFIPNSNHHLTPASTY